MPGDLWHGWLRGLAYRYIVASEAGAACPSRVLYVPPQLKQLVIPILPVFSEACSEAFSGIATSRKSDRSVDVLMFTTIEIP